MGTLETMLFFQKLPRFLTVYFIMTGSACYKYEP